MSRATTNVAPVIRPASAGDAEHVVTLARLFAPEVDDPPATITPAHIRRDALGDDPWYEVLVAEFDPDHQAAGLVGYAILTRFLNPNSGARGHYIIDFYVHPEVRRQGIGRALMAGLVRHSATRGGTFLRWDVWKPNARAFAFYGALGAHPEEDLTMMVLEGNAFSHLAL